MHAGLLRHNAAQQGGVEASRTLRIAMVAACPFPAPRGTPIRILRLAEALARRGHELHVVTYHLGEDLTDRAIRVHRTPALRTYQRFAPGPTYQKLLVLDPLLRRRLGRLLREHDIDLVHAHHYEGLLAALRFSWRSSPPVVYDAHTLLGSELPFYPMRLGSSVQRALGRFLDRQLPGRAAHVIAVSEALRRRLLELGAVPEERVTVVTNGVDARAFDVAPEVRSDGSRTVVFAGNLAPYQGLEFLLEAFRHVNARRRDARLLIVSESDFSPYERLADHLGISGAIELRRVPFREQPPYLRGASAAINPRVECDGVPQKLMNYMAAGCPIVSFAGSAVHLRDGVNGLVVRDGDTAAMGEAILRLLDDPAGARRLGETAREEILRYHGWDRAAREAEAVYAKLLNRPVGPISCEPRLSPPRFDGAAPVRPQRVAQTGRAGAGVNRDRISS